MCRYADCLHSSLSRSLRNLGPAPALHYGCTYPPCRVFSTPYAARRPPAGLSKTLAASCWPARSVSAHRSGGPQKQGIALPQEHAQCQQGPQREVQCVTSRGSCSDLALRITDNFDIIPSQTSLPAQVADERNGCTIFVHTAIRRLQEALKQPRGGQPAPFCASLAEPPRQRAFPNLQNLYTTLGCPSLSAI